MSAQAETADPAAILAATLTRLRTDAGLSLNELDRRAGLAKSTARSIETGKAKKPEWDTVRKLADALGVTADVLAGGAPADPGAAAQPADFGGETFNVSLRSLRPSLSNPRVTFDDEAIATLADSIAAHGVLQNLIVTRASQPGEYTIVGGERRWRALHLLAARHDWPADEHNIPVRLVEGEEAHLRAIALLENLQREAVPPLEEAAAFASLRDLDPESWSTPKIAAAIGKSRRYVELRLRLLSLAEPVQDALTAGKLTVEQARAIALAPDAEEQAVLAQRVIGGHDYMLRTTADIRRAAVGRLVPAERAIFPLDRYTGPWTVDGDDRWFADVEQFMKLQKSAAEMEVRRLVASGEWQWAELVESMWFNPLSLGWTKNVDDRAVAGAAVWLDPTDGEVKIVTGLAKEAEEEDDRDAEEVKADLEREREAHAAAVAARKADGDALTEAWRGGLRAKPLPDLARMIAFSIVSSATAGPEWDLYLWSHQGGAFYERWREALPAWFDGEGDLVCVDDEDRYDEAWAQLLALSETEVAALLTELLGAGVNFNGYTVARCTVPVAEWLGVDISGRIRSGIEPPEDEPDDGEAPDAEDEA